jgi:hypothetical protein
VTYSPDVAVRRAGALKRPLYLKNSRGSHRVVAVQRLNARLYRVTTEDGGEFTVDPDYKLWRRP